MPRLFLSKFCRLIINSDRARISPTVAIESLSDQTKAAHAISIPVPASVAASVIPATVPATIATSLK